VPSPAPATPPSGGTPSTGSSGSSIRLYRGRSRIISGHTHQHRAPVRPAGLSLVQTAVRQPEPRLAEAA
jgi:hypothetical protein